MYYLVISDYEGLLNVKTSRSCFNILFKDPNIYFKSSLNLMFIYNVISNSAKGKLLVTSCCSISFSFSCLLISSTMKLLDNSSSTIHQKSSMSFAIESTERFELLEVKISPLSSHPSNHFSLK